jgi:ribose transport system ATP-binding protein
MNVIGGVVAPTTGQMRWRGDHYHPASPADATMRGIAFIHQELNLFTNLSVAENIFIDSFPRRFGMIDAGAMRERTVSLLARLNLNATPDTPVGHLAPGERQLVEIAKALHREAQLIIFDEPTTSLTARETERLFETIAALKAAGTTIIYISHILSDVRRLSDRIAVLRDGRLVGQGAVSEFDVPSMIQSMIGRELSNIYPPRTAAPSAEVVLSVEGLSQAGVVEDISLAVRSGEILGLFGLMGSGRTELARMIFGLDPVAAGTVTLNGAPLAGNARDRIRAGLAFVTENRREEGLMMDAAIADNLALAAIEDFGRPPLSLLDDGRLRSATEATRDHVRIKATDIATQPVRALSGGNQQKVVIGKWLMNKPRLFLLDEPTRGVDVGAKHEIYTIIDRLAGEGNGVLLISSELEELIGTCDRIVVMNHGEITGEFEKSDFSESAILAAAFRETVN